MAAALAVTALAVYGIAVPLSAGGALVNGRAVTASALRSVSILDSTGAARSVNELDRC
ncbi:hypothetical protein T492DRAFT_890508 [Pavlovales sp. CCMP2436]|nr:hypothetical protein T492DRAFT_890508 [Pavlovales sp. CCMP2436]